MCRLGFISASESHDITREVMIASTLYGDTNKDGFGFATEPSRVIKTEKSAKDFWLENKDMNIITKNVMFHVRFATTGDVKTNNSHPFANENGTLALVHNGCLYGFDKAKEELEKRGHKFSSECDSEILLHAFEKWKTGFIKKLKELGTTGYATIVMMDNKKQIFVYTDNSALVFYKSKGIIIGTSSKEVFGDKCKEAKDGIFYTIENGKIVSGRNIGELTSYAYSETTIAHDGYYGFHNGKVIETASKENLFGEKQDVNGNDVNPILSKPTYCPNEPHEQDDLWLVDSEGNVIDDEGYISGERIEEVLRRIKDKNKNKNGQDTEFEFEQIGSNRMDAF